MKTQKTGKKLLIPVFFILLSVILIWPACDRPKNTNQSKVRGTFSISGAFALYPLTVKWVEEFRKEYPDIQVDVSAGGAGKGMVDVLAGMVDLGMFSRSVTPAEEEKGIWYIAVAKDAVVATINQENPFNETLQRKGVAVETLAAIYLDNKPWFWSDLSDSILVKSPIHVYTRSDACGAAQVWASFFSSNQESLHGIGVFGDPGMADAIKKDVLGLGYNNVAYAYDINTRKKYAGMEILPIDFNNNGLVDHDEQLYQSLDTLMKAIGSGKYPTPPARDLYFIAKGNPDNPLVRLFLNWILSSGQNYVERAGYVRLSDQTIVGQKLLLDSHAR